MALPSLADVILVIIIIIPGFISLCLFRWLAVYERKITDNQLTLMSLVCSFFIYGIFSYLTGISEIDKFRDIIFVPRNLFLILILGMIIGGIPGILIRFLYRRNILTGECWEIAMKEASRKGSWIIVYTSDEKEYMGTLHYSGSGDDPREISIRSPTMIIRNKQGEVENEFDCGKEIFFTEEDIKRVVFFKEV
ncbi:MAG: hypothetical protein ACFFDT_13955 [Candidatus Hodarchaeota archaeon]